MKGSSPFIPVGSVGPPPARFVQPSSPAMAPKDAAAKAKAKAAAKTAANPVANQTTGPKGKGTEARLMALLETQSKFQERMLSALNGKVGAQEQRQGRAARNERRKQAEEKSEWTCSTCGHMGNPGWHQRCHGCNKTTRPVANLAPPGAPNQATAAAPAPAAGEAPAAPAAGDKPPQAGDKPEPTLQEKLNAALRTLESVKAHPPGSEREIEVARWESRVENLRKAIADSRPVHSRIQSATTKLENARKTQVEAEAKVVSLKEQLAAAEKALSEATAVTVTADAEYQALMATPPPPPGAQADEELRRAMTLLVQTLLQAQLPPELGAVVQPVAALLQVPPAAPPTPAAPAAQTGAKDPDAVMGTGEEQGEGSEAPTLKRAKTSAAPIVVPPESQSSSSAESSTVEGTPKGPVGTKTNPLQV